MSDSGKWLEDLRSAKSAIKSAGQSIRDVRAWVYQNGTRQFPLELDQSFEALDKSLQNAATFVGAIDETNTSLMTKALSGQRLSRVQFHLLSALGVLNYTNKTAGLSEYDDYEVFQHFCYERGEDHAYITPDMEPLEPSVTVDGTTTYKVRAFAPGRPPEEIPLDHLKAEQRLFFERYLPNVVARFKGKT